VSETLAVAGRAPAPTAAPHRRRRRVRIGPLLLVAVGGLVALAIPFYATAFWLQLALFAFAAGVAALGLTMLIGQAGQLSLGHSFFVAVGAYGYTYLAGENQTIGVSHQAGLSLPPVVAALGAVVLAGVAGALFSPIAAHLRGIYLGVASLALVFGGQHVLYNAAPLTGGFNGRNVPVFEVAGFRFETSRDETLFVLGIPFGREEKLWYLFLAILVVAYVYYRNVARGRPGRALRAVRDRELMAGIIGVPVVRYKGYAFAVSSMYAGIGGVLLALAFGRIVPETFGIALAIEYLAMVVIGGLGSPGGAIAGAAFVTCLPAVLERYAGVLPGLAPAGEEGISPGVAARFAYGFALIAVLLIEPGGLAAVAKRLTRLTRLTRSPRPDRA
jgi:branched-chain amino acid transport system permease protein